MRRYRLSRFAGRPWPLLVEELRALAETTAEYRPLHRVAASVAASPAAAVLAGRASLGAFAVTPVSGPDPPDEVLRVQLESDGEPGWVLVWHQTVTGRDDMIRRPAAEAVPLFWRFAIEKFGVHPD